MGIFAVGDSIMKNGKGYASITLRVQSEVLLPEEISQILQISSTKSHCKGEKMSSKNPLSENYEANLWLLEFEEKDSFDELFVEVSNFLAKNQDSLLTLSERCNIDLFCGYSPKESQDSFFLNHETLRKIANIPIDIIFDVYSL